jgi:NADPH:quinone reductase-like Zn-dependent oxidoreductase
MDSRIDNGQGGGPLGRYADPWVPGYNAAGIVHQVGADVTSFKVGDRVVRS